MLTLTLTPTLLTIIITIKWRNSSLFNKQAHENHHDDAILTNKLHPGLYWRSACTRLTDFQTSSVSVYTSGSRSEVTGIICRVPDVWTLSTVVECWCEKVFFQWQSWYLAQSAGRIITVWNSGQVLSSNWHRQPFGHKRHGPKIGVVPLFWRGDGSLCNTMWPAPRPTSVPSGILIHPTVWPQYTNITFTDIQTTVR